VVIDDGKQDRFSSPLSVRTLQNLGAVHEIDSPKFSKAAAFELLAGPNFPGFVEVFRLQDAS
jgi:hypothetical protein